MISEERAGLDDLALALGIERVKRGEVVGPHTTFKIGGPADLWYVAHSRQELKAAVMAARNRRMPYFILGTGANILVGDRGMRGIVIKNEARQAAIDSDGVLRADSGALVADLIALAIARGFSGLEHYAGIPSSVGGALWQNLHFLAPDRARTLFVGECLKGATILTEEGQLRDVTAEYFRFGYDDSILHHRRDVVLSASFQLVPEDPAVIRQTADANLEWRRERHPGLSAFPSAGSIFKKIEGVGAGRLIDQCGLKGLICGGAQVAPRHANFIVNLGGASARDVLALVRACQEQVAERFGHHLEMEVSCVGDL